MDCGACSERSEESRGFAEPAPSRLEIASADLVSLAMTGEGASPRNRSAPHNDTPFITFVLLDSGLKL